MRKVILVDGRRGRIIDVDSGETADVGITIEVEPKRSDSTGIAIKLVGAAFVFAALCTFGWPGLLLVLLVPMLAKL